LYDAFSIQNGLKQENALLPLFCNFALEFPIQEVQENQQGLELSGTHQFLVYADDLNLLNENVNTVKKNTETIIHQ
jgi:hypothetical protein